MVRYAWITGLTLAIVACGRSGARDARAPLDHDGSLAQTLRSDGDALTRVCGRGTTARAATAAERARASALALRGHEAAIVGDTATARAEFGEALRLNPTDAATALLAARASDAAADTAGALRAYCTYLVTSPTGGDAPAARGRVLALAAARAHSATPGGIVSGRAMGGAIVSAGPSPRARAPLGKSRSATRTLARANPARPRAAGGTPSGAEHRTPRVARGGAAPAASQPALEPTVAGSTHESRSVPAPAPAGSAPEPAAPTSTTVAAEPARDTTPEPAAEPASTPAHRASHTARDAAIGAAIGAAAGVVVGRNAKGAAIGAAAGGLLGAVIGERGGAP